MPPHLYPPDPHFPAAHTSGASAERAVWQALRDTLPDDAALFANLAILHDATEHEIDLLVAWPGVGLAVIETKGGHITRRDGAWYQGRPPQQHHIDPVRQAQDARHALQRWLRANGAHDAARSRTAHLVAFPHTPSPRTGTPPRRRGPSCSTVTTWPTSPRAYATPSRATVAATRR